MSIRIATWNVNSIRVRLPALLEWLSSSNPDILLLQETKCQDVDFPRAEIEAAGFHVVFHGQKTFNGVAILSRQPAESVVRGLPGDESDPQARYLEAIIDGIRVVSLYLPNGNPVPGGKYVYKLDWMRRLTARARDVLTGDLPVVLGGGL
ncbi:exodeoxyribonuclease III [Magnetospirillum molischianum]|uniref:Exodeoxyribonuclease III n=1 Tax=Magnetospirillum molischianum DSM 120 TaxID=1150626 RepID=H8FRE7_MAGML